VAHGISVKFGLWAFHKLKKKQKKFDYELLVALHRRYIQPPIAQI